MADWVEEPGAIGRRQWPGGLDNPSTLSVLSGSVNDLLKTAGRRVDPALGPARVCSRRLWSLHWLLPAVRNASLPPRCFLEYGTLGGQVPEANRIGGSPVEGAECLGIARLLDCFWCWL